MTITQLKIFGERNTGTNWMENLVLQNYKLPLLHHRDLIENHMTVEHRAMLGTLPELQRNYARALITDWIFEQCAGDLFGWKHGCVDYDQLNKIALFSQTGFIFVVRHPYSFIKSLHKKPYHALISPPENLDDFIGSSWLAMHKDNLQQPLLPSPLLLWNLKVKSYFKFLEQTDNAIVVRYEDILENFETLFDLIAQKFSVSISSSAPLNPATKRTADYKSTYSNVRAFEGISSDSLEYMGSIVDRDLVNKLQYEI